MPSVLLLMPFLVALVLAVLLGGPIIALLRRLRARQIISSDAPQRHQSKAGTPSMGGLIFLTAALISAFWIGRITPGLVALALLTIAFMGIGLLDDTLIVLRGKNLGLKARQKLALQILFGLLFVIWFHGQKAVASSQLSVGSGDGNPLLSQLATGNWQLSTVLLAGLHLLLIVAMSNAVNLADGLDGLAAGLAVPLWLVMGLIAHLAPQLSSLSMGWDQGVSAYCMAFAGACLGFLWFNSHPATVFMGDTGALALGGGMAGVAILLRAEWALLLAGSVYLAEMVSVMLQVASFKTTRRRIFRMTPLHHHFELIGWPETKIVARFTLLGVAFAALTLMWLLR
jgi:phospho-N-acetylmuramoyl-pentapeptide-transferase